jgi:hypothetical protein
MRGGAARGQTANVGKHVDHDRGVVVIVRRKRANDLEVAGEFFADFAEQGGGGLFVGFDFAAGKFPFEAEVFVRGTLGDEDAASGVEDQSANDGDRRMEWGVQDGE